MFKSIPQNGKFYTYVKKDVVSMRADHGRLSALDGLRGVAAVAVVAEHCLLTNPQFWAAFQADGWWSAEANPLVSALSYTPLRVLWAGSPAVAIFFVLSGFVLSLPYWRGAKLEYLSFAIKRIFRLYPIYIISLFLAAALYAFSENFHRTGMSSWSSHYWISGMSAEAWIRALLFLPGPMLQLNSPLWTLIHEARISLLMPLMVIAMRWRPITTLALCVAVSFSAKIVLAKGSVTGLDAANALETLSQIWLFAAGCYVAKNVENIRVQISRSPALLMTSATYLAVIGLVAKWIIPMPSIAGYTLTSLSATFLVAAVACWKPAQHPLENPVAQLLGTISYPMYAIHFPILFWSLHSWPLMPAWAAILLSIVISITLAAALARTIEPLSIAFGKQLATLLSDARRRSISAAG